MAENKEKAPFIGKTKRHVFPDGGFVDNFNLHADDINKYIDPDTGWLNLNVYHNKSGDGIYVKVNTFKKKS